ncbi:unnamed protein product [Mytilus edulis]|uniref:Uncharacterized protein n=1 Tax=Mytilus edulis TaxID=6550 RepID=A0A8S3U7I6_MYTED|nr:unnamed protein product [Mytilus edulis]
MVSAEEQDRHKRLLLNDPDVINSRLVNLEKSMQDIVRLTQQQQTTIAQLQTELAQEKEKVSQALLNERLRKTPLKDDSSEAKKSKIEKSDQNKKQTSENYCIQKLYSNTGPRKFTKRQRMLYSQIGFAAGQEYLHSHYYGGPANMLCLPNNPEISNRTAPGNSLLVGTEYDNGNFFANGAHNEDVPCALCRSSNTSASIMIPGRKSCDSGWKIEYNGILASGAFTHKPSSYICLDSHPEFLQGGQGDQNGHVLYGTSTKCGSLACPPYVDNMAINCVVCSK